MTDPIRESEVALAQAEALSLVIRGVHPDRALAELRELVDDPDVLAIASDRCLAHRAIAPDVARQAVDLLATAAMQARCPDGHSSAAPSGP